MFKITMNEIGQDFSAILELSVCAFSLKLQLMESDKSFLAVFRS